MARMCPGWLASDGKATVDCCKVVGGASAPRYAALSGWARRTSWVALLVMEYALEAGGPQFLQAGHKVNHAPPPVSDGQLEHEQADQAAKFLIDQQFGLGQPLRCTVHAVAPADSSPSGSCSGRKRRRAACVWSDQNGRSGQLLQTQYQP